MLGTAACEDQNTLRSLGVGSFRTALAAPEVSFDESPERPEIFFGQSREIEPDAVLDNMRLVAVAVVVVAESVFAAVGIGPKHEAEDVRRKAVEADNELPNPIEERRARPVPFEAGAATACWVLASASVGERDPDTDAPKLDNRPSVDAEKDEGGDTLLARRPARPVDPKVFPPPSFSEPETDVDVDIDRRFEAGAGIGTAGFDLEVNSFRL